MEPEVGEGGGRKVSRAGEVSACDSESSCRGVRLVRGMSLSVRRVCVRVWRASDEWPKRRLEAAGSMDISEKWDRRVCVAEEV